MQAESVSPVETLPSATELAPQKPPTPWTWRVGIAVGILLIGGFAYILRNVIGPRGQAVAGIFCFFGLVAMFSSNLRAVNWRTIGWGIVLQVILAVLVLKVPFVHDILVDVKNVVTHFIDFSDKGAEFVFGNLARPGDIALNPGKEMIFMFAFKALPPILFISAFFTMLYHYGILQRIVRAMALVWFTSCARAARKRSPWLRMFSWARLKRRSSSNLTSRA